jgi:RNA polymerase sigma-70 factor (TIGR02943 family)
MQPSKISRFANPHGWVGNYADILYSYAIARINDEEQARDLVQETFLAALERVDKFEGRSSESTWLMAILKNKVIDVYRRSSAGLRKRTDVLTAEEEQQDFFDPIDGHWKRAYCPGELEADLQDPVVQKELGRVLQTCLGKLPTLWLSVFTMKHVDDAASEIICRELKLTPSNFWVIIHRAKLNLRACLQKNWL